MSSSETLIWSGSYPGLPSGGCLLPGLLFNPVVWPGYLALLLLSFFSLPLWWSLPLLIPHLFVVFGVLMTTLMNRNLVRTAEFTPQRVVMTRRRGNRVREVDVAELTTVAVEHFGSEGEGYTQTCLRLEWTRRITVAISIPGRHDETLAPSLTRLLGRPVAETWHDVRSRRP